MAITINVQAVNSGGGNNNQNPTPSNNATPSPQQQQPSQQPTPYQPQPMPPQSSGTTQQNVQYQRPNFGPYRQPTNVQAVNNPLPTSDRMVNDIRAEISRRGIILVPGTANYSIMLNTLQQNMRNNVMGQIESQHTGRIADIDTRRDNLMAEISARLETARQAELSQATSEHGRNKINQTWDAKLNEEEQAVNRFFRREYLAADTDRENQTDEAEQRLTEALHRLTEELSQGNKDSYLNNLRDKYKEQIWRRDNAATEEEVREASREASKIQERMQRAMNGGMSPAASRFIGTAASMLTIAGNAAIQWDRNRIQQDYVGLDMASSVLNGNATAAIRQRNALKEQENMGLATAGGAIAGMAAGAAIGSIIPGVGTVIGGAIGGVIGGFGGNALSHGLNRDMLIEDERTKVADLWRQEEQRVMQFNDLAMLYRRFSSDRNDIGAIRNTMVEASGERAFMSPSSGDKDKTGTGVGDVASKIVEAAQDLVNTQSFTNGNNVWRRSESQLDLYDLGYTAPEFAQQLARRIKQRGLVTKNSIEKALNADALERVFSLNSGALGALSQYDRIAKGRDNSSKEFKLLFNDSNQEFTNLAYTLSGLGTIGMQEGAWARSDEFAGYMTQLAQSQRSTFLNVNLERAAKQIATAENLFGWATRTGPEVMQGIEAVNRQVQNPGGGLMQTLLYDVIQELYPESRGRIDKIEQFQYDIAFQDEIQREFAKRLKSIYGGVDTTSGYLAFQEAYGIKNPFILHPIAKQMYKEKGGGLEAIKLDKSHSASEVAGILNNGYTPETTQRVNALADQQMKSLLHYQESITDVVKNILDKIESVVAEKLQEAVDALNK